MHQNVKAILKVIRWAEGTLNEKGYNTIYSYKYFSDFSNHPNIKVCANNICSTAAGAYQFLYSTFKEESKRIGTKDFSPETQDKLAISRLKYRKAYKPLIEGDILLVLDRISWEWASLPNRYGKGRYGQPIKTLNQVLSKYIEFGGKKKEY